MLIEGTVYHCITDGYQRSQKMAEILTRGLTHNRVAKQTEDPVRRDYIHTVVTVTLTNARNIHCVSKRRDVELFATNVNRFSKLFHCWKQKGILLII